MKAPIFAVLLAFVGCVYPTSTLQEEDDDKMNQRSVAGPGPKTGWGISGTLVTGDNSRQLSLQAQFAETGTYTASFSKVDNPAATNPIFAEAMIIWGVEGNSVSRRVNVGDGVSISGTGQSVKIIITDATSAAFAGNVPAAYTVSVQVARGVRGSNSQPPTLLPTTTPTGDQNGSGRFQVLPATTLVIPVPRNAGVISMFVTSDNLTAGVPAVGDLTIQQSYGIFVMKQYDPSLYTGWVPMTPSVDSIVIRNSNNIDAYLVSVVFGIDG